MSRRRSGEGSIYPVNGYRGYVWCTSPAGKRYRKYVKGKTYEDARAAWLKLRDAASRGPVSQMRQPWKVYYLLAGRNRKPNLAPKTCEKYELFSRLHIIPHLGARRLDKLQVRDIRQWLNKLAHLPVLRARERRRKGGGEATMLRHRQMLPRNAICPQSCRRPRYPAGRVHVRCRGRDTVP